jgi:tRNA pseudouridine38-40 synthase
MRVKAVIAYDGSLFQGFQRQRSTINTVTTAIENALKSLQINAAITGSGRTDAGVHATGQVIHFDLPLFWTDLAKLKSILNRKLVKIQFRDLSFVEDGFHARFSAKNRRYRYLFKTKPLSVFEKDYLAFYPPSFNIKILQKALKMFEGEHDFLCFHKTGSPTHTTVRTIYQARYYTYKEYHIITFQANGFLRSQVRMMVEAAMQCAQGKILLETLHRQIESHEGRCSQLAPAPGLYLAKITY